MCVVVSSEIGIEYSIIRVKIGKSIKTIVAIHDRRSEMKLKGKYNVKLGSPIKETTLATDYPELLEAINNRRTSVYRFIDKMGNLP